MDSDDDGGGWDGPNIRPPQASHESSRSRYGGSRHHAPHRRGNVTHLEQRHRRDKPQHHRRDRSRDRNRRTDEDLRERINRASNRASASSSSSRPGSRVGPGQNHRGTVPPAAKDSRTKSDLLPADRRDVEVRRQRREIERQMEQVEREVKRKRDRSRDGGHTEEQKRRRHVVIDEDNDEGELVDLVEEEGQIEDDGSAGSQEGSETDGEGASESGEVDDSDSDNTGSKRSEATPNHDDEDEEEVDEDDVDAGHGEQSERQELPVHTLSDEDQGDHDVRINQRAARKSRSRSFASESTPSRSPTPRRNSDEEDSADANQYRKYDASPSGSNESLAEAPTETKSLRTEGPEAAAASGPTPQNSQACSGDESDEQENKLPVYLPSVCGCRSVEEFQCLNRIEEGTYGIVYRAKDKKTNKIVALKRLKMEKEREGFPITSLREINTLLISQHPNVVTVREIVVGSNMDKIYIVMDFVEHDLKSLMETMREKKQVFLPGEIKCLMQQLLRAIAHLHDNWILHRDLKTSNLLLSHNGILKVGDFGLAREYGSPLKPYTAVVVTLWYRAPELLLGIKEYSTHIDIWSIGCIFGELLLMEPLFAGKSDIDQLNRIYKLLGTPSEKIWTGYNELPAVQKMKFIDYPISHFRSKFPLQMLSDAGLQLFKRFLTYDPKKRVSCEEALKADYFVENPLPIDPSMFPTWPAKSESSSASGSHAQKKAASPKPPSGGGAFKKINEDEEEYSKYAGFTLNASRNVVIPAGWNLKF